MIELVKQMSPKERKRLQRVFSEWIYYGLQHRKSFVDRYRSCLKFYFGKQLSEREKQLLSLRGQEHFINNHLRPNLKSLQAFLTANKPTWQVISVASDDTFVRKISNGMMTYIWDTSIGYMRMYRVIRNGIVGGMGLAMPIIDYSRRDGLGDVIIKDVPTENFIGDWRSREPDQRDARFQMIWTQDYVTKALAIRPDLKDKIKNFIIGEDEENFLIEEDDLIVGRVRDMESVSTGIVNFVEIYRLVDRRLYEAIHKITGQVFNFIEHPAEIVNPSDVDIRQRDKVVLEKYLCLYNGIDTLILDKEIFPFDRYLISPFIDEDTDNIFPLGEVFFTIDLQRWLNKSYQMTLFHTQMASNPGVFIPAGNDPTEVERKYSIPGFVIPLDMTRGTPIFKQPQPLSSGYFELAKDFANEIRHSMGTFAPFIGDPSSSKGNATETLILQERGAERARVISRNFEVCLEQLGKATWEMARYHYNFPMWLSWIDRNKTPHKIFINGTIVRQDGTIESLYLKDLDIDIKLAIGSYAPVRGIAHVKILQELLPVAPPHAQEQIFYKILEYLQIDQDIIDEMKQTGGIVQQIIAQLQSQQEQIGELTGIIQTLKNQLMTADRRAVKAQAEADFSKQLSKTKQVLAIEAEKAKMRNKENEKS